jgi:hypothetical protein
MRLEAFECDVEPGAELAELDCDVSYGFLHAERCVELG